MKDEMTRYQKLRRLTVLARTLCSVGCAPSKEQKQRARAEYDRLCKELNEELERKGGHKDVGRRFA